MPRINPTVTEEAEKVYESWDRGERGTHVSIAILEYEKRRAGGITLTESDIAYIVDLIRKEMGK